MMRSIVALAGILVASQATRAEDLRIIVNGGVSVAEISADDVRDIFLQTKSQLKGTGHLQPVLVRSGMAELAQRLGKTESGLEIYYRSLVFSGRGAMPVYLKTESDVVTYVAKNRDAIAYVHESVLRTGVRALRLK